MTYTARFWPARCPCAKVIADGSHLPGDLLPQATALLASSLSLDGQLLGQKLTPERRYLVVKHQVPEQNGGGSEKRDHPA